MDQTIVIPLIYLVLVITMLVITVLGTIIKNKGDNMKNKIYWLFTTPSFWGVLMLGVLMTNFIIYKMSLNNWDIRCVFTECEPITVRSEE